MSPAIQSQEEVIKYLLLVMKHTEFKPDYHKVAQEAGIASANSAQKRFKKYVELAGFSLVGGAVVGPGANHGTPAKAKTLSNKVATGAPVLVKKRKITTGPTCGEEGEDQDLKQEAGSE